MLKYNRFSLFFIALLISSFIFGFSTVSAAPTITITNPKGGEVLSGTTDITWTASDSENSQDFNSTLWYSTPAGIKDNLIATNIDLLQVCNFSTISNYWVQDNKFIAGLPATAHSGQAVVFNLGSDLVLLDPIYQGSSVAAYTFNGSSWIPNYDYNLGLYHMIQTDQMISPILKTFSNFGDGKTYLFVGENTPSAIKTFSWNGSQWIINYDKNIGLQFSGGSSYVGYDIFEYGGKIRLILRESVLGTIGFDWNGAGWSRNDYIATGLGGNTYSYSVFFQGNTPFVLRGNSTLNPEPNWLQQFDNGVWTENYDLNAGILPTSNGVRSNFFNYNGKLYFLMLQYFPAAGDYNAYYLATETVKKTSSPATCSYSWDTTTALNGKWYLDLNSQSVNSSVFVSSNQFQIQNYSSSDMNAVCVENCNVLGFDGNGIVINPGTESDSIKFYIQNNFVSKSALLKINNSLKDGKRYFIYSSSSDSNYSFNDSLTYGSAVHTNGLQKIWNPLTKKYVYSFADEYFGGEKTYYWLKYQAPMKVWDSLISTAWDNQLIPQTTDFNGAKRDFFNVSNYVNIGSETKQRVPNIFLSPGANYVFVFNADTNSSTQKIYSGFATERGQTTATFITANTSDHTYHFSGDDGYLSIRTDATIANIVGLSDYALMQRGYFMQDIVLTNSDGSALPVMIDNNQSFQYIKEGKNFNVSTKLYDRAGTLKSVEIIVYLETLNDSNKVLYQYYDYSDLTETETVLDFEKTVSGIVDFIPGNKNAKIVVRATNLDGSSEIRTDWIKFVQFPYYPNDFSISAIVLNKQLGKAPQITVNVRTIAPETLRGIKVYFSQEGKAPNQSDYNAAYFIPENMSCNGFDCSFTKTIDDWVWSKQGLWIFTASALLTTQNEDYNSVLTSVSIPVFINYKAFETLRVFETVERPSHEYRNDEEIRLVLQTRAADYRNIKDEIMPYINLSNCDAETAGNCTIQDLNFSPISFYYDEKTGYNYWFWRNVFLNDNGTLLSDGNFYRVFARINDKTQSYNVSSGLTAVLAPKCKTYPTDCNSFFCFVSNALASLNHFLTGCIEVSPTIITNVSNTASEIRLDINSAKVLTPPTLECVVCQNPDQNNVYASSLEQPINCLAWYKLNEAPTDKWDISIANQYSDFSKTGNTKQYLNISIPSEIIELNDVGLMRQSLEKNYGTTIDTAGKLLFYQWNSMLVPYLNNLKTIPTMAVNAGLVPNTGFDCNFDRPISPNYLNGMVFFKINGLQFYNMQDYVLQYSDLNKINPKDFLEYMNYKNRSLPIKKTFVNAFINNNEKIYSEETESPLVINVLPQNAVLKKQNLDSNSANNFETAPINLKFDFITDLFYSNETGVIRRFVPLNFQAIINLTGYNGIAIAFQQLLTNPLPVIFKNAWWILGALLVLLIISLIYSNFQKPGGKEITFLRR